MADSLGFANQRKNDSRWQTGAFAMGQPIAVRTDYTVAEVRLLAKQAKDAAQEIFIKMYQHLDDVRDGSSFLPWMLRLTRNCCIDRVRSRKARGFELTVAEAAPEAQSASSAASPEETLLESGRRNLLYRALARLTKANREIMVLKEIEELKLEDISTRLGVPLGTVKSRSNRARVEQGRARLLPRAVARVHRVALHLVQVALPGLPVSRPYGGVARQCRGHQAQTSCILPLCLDSLRARSASHCQHRLRQRRNPPQPTKLHVLKPRLQ